MERGDEQIGIRREEITGGPKPAPSVLEVPPTDDELELLNKLRRANNTGIDSLMFAVLNGRDITRPIVINALMDLTRKRQTDQQVQAANLEQWSRRIVNDEKRLTEIEKQLTETAEKVDRLEVAANNLGQFCVMVSRWLHLPWRKRHAKDLPVPPTTEHGAPEEGGAGK